jgi:predicted transcriptional regulator of viral defense system
VARLGYARSNKARPPRDGRGVAALAASQHGVVTVRQLETLGFDAVAVHRRVKDGWLHSLYRGVYAVGHSSISMRGRYLAAVLACGPRAALSHRSAAHLWGLLPGPNRIEVTAPRGRIAPRGLRMHVSRMMDEADFEMHDRIRITTVHRTLLDIAAVVSADALARGSRCGRAARALRSRVPGKSPLTSQRASRRLRIAASSRRLAPAAYAQ